MDVSDAHGPSLQRGGVRAGTRSGVAVAEVDVGGDDPGQERRPLLGSPLFMIVGPTVLIVSAGAPRLIEEHELLEGRTALDAPFLRPADRRPAVGTPLLPDPAHERTHRVGRG